MVIPGDPPEVDYGMEFYKKPKTINNSEWFESVKEFFNTEWQGLEPLPEQMQKDGNRLIAYVEELREERDKVLEMYHPQDTDHKILKLKEENAKLKLEARRNLFDLGTAMFDLGTVRYLNIGLLKENAKLKEAVEELELDNRELRGDAIEGNNHRN